MLTTVLSLILILIVLVVAAVVIVPYFFGAPWHPTSAANIRRALELCEAKPGESLYDLGCGDGRVLIAGAKEFGLNGVGLEIDPLKAWIAKWRVRRAGLSDRIRIHRKNVHDFEYGQADILFIYLTHQALDRLSIPNKQMKREVRIVCYRFCLKGVTPDRASTDETLFLYRLNKGTRINAFS